MDRWAWEQLDPWLEIPRELPLGALLYVIHGPPRAAAGKRRQHTSNCTRQPHQQA
ncbi:MAG TPA: hypothetical protein VFI54_02960 [Solirubrobacteraceae bacterium]|nr:hypothetical protein [Solirubrobacteraceae bacterium]